MAEQTLAQAVLEALTASTADERGISHDIPDKDTWDSIEQSLAKIGGMEFNTREEFQLLLNKAGEFCEQLQVQCPFHRNNLTSKQHFAMEEALDTELDEALQRNLTPFIHPTFKVLLFSLH